MKKIFIFGLTIVGILAFSFGLRYFPNILFFVLAVFNIAFFFLMTTLLKGDTKLIGYVEKAHLLRLIFVLVPGLALGLSLTGLTLWGVYLHLFEANPMGTTEIASAQATGRSMPPGTYSNLVLLMGISSFSVFFGTITIAALRGTFLGLKYRFGFKKS